MSRKGGMNDSKTSIRLGTAFLAPGSLGRCGTPEAPWELPVSAGPPADADEGTGTCGQGARPREVLIEEALKTSEIEGEKLDVQAVRSSVARRLGLPTAGLPFSSNRQADGVVEILLDATQGHDEEPTTARLFGWHAALFPTGYSGLHKINVASWRDDREGPMRVISGPVGRETIHYQAPPAGEFHGVRL